MGKKVAKPEPAKHQLTSKEVLALTARWVVLENKIAPLADELSQIKETLVADMEPKDAYEFRSITLRCIQAFKPTSAPLSSGRL